VTAGVDRQLRAMYTKWFCACSDDLMRMLTSLEACVCCFAGADLPAVGSELRGASAPKVRTGEKPRLSKGALAPDGKWDAAEVLPPHHRPTTVS
jgi:hypothetical protein